MRYPPKIGQIILSAYGLLAAGVLVAGSPAGQSDRPLVGPAERQASAEEPMRTYKNNKFEFQVDYAAFLRGAGESQSGDGQDFETSRSADGSMTMVVFGSPNTTGATIEQLRDEFVTGDGSSKRKITQSVVSRPPEKWFIVSGKEDEEIFYRKVILKRNDVIVTLHFTYPDAAKDRYNPVVAATQRSLQ